MLHGHPMRFATLQRDADFKNAIPEDRLCRIHIDSFG